MLPLNFYIPDAPPVGAPSIPRAGSIRLHDTTIGIWEDAVNERDFQQQVFGPLIRFLRDAGWKIGRDASTHQHYRCLSPTTRYCRRASLEARLSLHGRCIEFVIYQNVANVSNPNGGRYDFDKLERMPQNLRLQCIATLRRVVAHLRERHGYALSLPDIEAKHLGPMTMTAVELVERGYATCCHTRKDLGRPDWSGDFNRESANGTLLEQGQAVYLRDRSGRWLRGKAFYALNNMWKVVTGPYSLTYLSCHEIHTERPTDLRRKANAGRRRERLERELSAAVRAMDFARADQLRRLIFGNEALFRIWSTKNSAWYGPCRSGYTADAARAGLYTEKEAHAAAGGIAQLRIVPISNSAPQVRLTSSTLAAAE